MRGKFNTSVDVYKGPLSGDPGQFVGTFPCKLVLEDAIDAEGLGCPVIRYYLTIDEYEPVGSWTYPSFGMSPGLADNLAVPSGTSPQFWVLYTDLIRWRALTPYWRSYLCSLPIPAAIGSGGVYVGGAAVLDFHLVTAAVGGVEVGGSGFRMIAKVYLGSGGVQVDSSAAWTFAGSGSHAWTFRGNVLFTMNFSPLQCGVLSTAGLYNGQNVKITGCVNNPALNGVWPISISDLYDFNALGSTPSGPGGPESTCYYYV